MGVGAAADAFVRLCTSAGFTVVALGPNTFRAARTRRPQWATVLAICTSIFAGVGLFFLLVKRTESGDASIVEDRTGTKLRLTGQLPLSLIAEISNVLSQPAEQRSIAGERSIAERWAPSVGTAAGTSTSMTPPIEVPSLLSSTPAAIQVPPTAPPPPPVIAPPPLAPMQSTAEGATVLRGSVAPSTVGHAVLVLPDSRRVPVGAGVVIGRAPQSDPGLPSALLVSLDDVSLSKTHLTVGPAAEGVWVIDRHSTNGTRVINGAATVQCIPGARAVAPFGATVVAGELQMLVGAA